MRALTRHLLVLACLIALSAPASYFAAKWLIHTKRPLEVQFNVFGPSAAAIGYPVPTPPDQPTWPSPTQVSRESALGVARVMTWAYDGAETTHSLQANLYGWPFPVFTQVQYWWPWNDPRWKSNLKPNQPLVTSWKNVVLNAITLALAFWGVIMIPWFLITLGRRAYRRSRNACQACGYPRGPSPQCAECGFTFTPSTH